MEKRKVELKGLGTMSFLETAAADRAVVCLHGLGQSSLMWRDSIGRLPAGWQGFAIDMLGFGDSDKPDSGYSIGMHAETVARFIEQLPHQHVVLAANSIGGVVALTTVVDHPGLNLRGLILVSSGPRVADKDAASAYRDKLKTLDMDLETARTTVRAFTHRELEDHRWTQVATEMVKARTAALHETLTSSITTDMVPRLAEIDVPTLVIQGREDRARSPEDGLTIVRGVPNARLVVLPEAGHTPMIEVPEEFQIWFDAMLGKLG